ncbi:DUF726-domain-containing protein [Gloeophyllum trabeum ATCC 11539]|uniref:DUF726-domain-containing protein n=1 Tax=Gloeophyllum trabeum (strain ATCC 11539 / FP-39264 / Madison 617) TaxID=670483 RepID=S7QFW2_GLOTA|nr:DUF726-domain-containing protein [Gloeophyllum trabeum ATCC 11539]EPQ58312.1 DUF726-domain-containing protein [Gloeophyllum trabeum ATCC 11539]
MSDLTKVSPPQELSEKERVVIFEHIFRRLANHRNTLELYADAERGLSTLPDESREKTKDDYIHEINSWANQLLQHAWAACREPGGGSCPDLSPMSDTSLAGLPKLPDKALSRKVFNAILFLHVTSSKQYSAHTRYFLTTFAPLDEASIAATLKDPDRAVSEAEKPTEQAKNQQAERGRTLRRVGMGLGAVAGGVLVGVTGGLAAPVVGAGVGSILSFLGVGGTAAGLLATGLASSSVVCGALFGAYGAKSTASMVERHTREVQDLAILPVRPPKETLAVRLCTSGWLTSQEDVVQPWTVFGGNDTYALQWEVEALRALSDALYTLIKAQAMQYVKAEIIKRTVLATLMSSLAPIAWLKIGRIIALAVKAGNVLGTLLAQRVFGTRPVTLVGYSLGSLVIFEALKYLSTLPPSETVHLVQDVFLFGLPAPSDPETWSAVRRVVAGRLVNGYAEDDYILAVLSRASDISWSVSGLEPVVVKGVDNVKCDQVEGHLQWRGMVGKCLESCGAEDILTTEVHLQVKEIHDNVQPR